MWKIKKVILPVLMSAMLVVPAVSHAEKQDNVKQTTAKAEQTMQKSGWVKEGDTWYFYDQKGMKKIGWLQDGGKWCYFDASGKMQTGPIEDGNNRFYLLGADGALHTNEGWVQYEGGWYYVL